MLARYAQQNCSNFIVTQVRWLRHWAKKKNVKSTHFLINDCDSSLYRPAVPGTILANLRRLPNRKTRPREYRVAATASGKFALVQPYPPNVNCTLAPYPKNVAGNQNDPNKLGNYKFVQKYKGIEYVSIKRMVPYPRGSSAYTFDVDRIVQSKKHK
ncbi:conserved hypothetical protein [Theileria orientalis strain Shintoku]|uniref:Uncharacterized protein n=1 Tax=Theileria orientalis strain Shintoku TaxID=869250 RepID=J4CC78_THEOR|nr:conserved hypothetical protein [Theileria orientalis strain Shintoku]BAM38917.1 conserved hypothetical protein [Theileria orientalis strain Shintoku]|eukprot:XP_009689218.1 conserved hypothetical protein [Theileria orientalis strain Shintoku]